MKPVLIFIVLILLITACDDSSPTKSKLDISVSPMENEEAELAAMWLSGELVAPTYLYRKIKRELELIRSTWHDSIPEVEIGFVPYVDPGFLVLGFEAETYISIRDSLYHEWDSLNDFYNVERYSVSSLSNSVYMRFKGRLNPNLLVDIYSNLPGGEYVHPSGKIGDNPFLLIYNARGKLKYFFRDAWGDCPAGCIYSTLNYFEVVNDSAAHRGSWYPDYPINFDDAPVWYDTAKIAFESYRYHNSWYKE